jgi:predicted nucleic acid-binding protein
MTANQECDLFLDTNILVYAFDLNAGQIIPRLRIVLGKWE